MKTINLFYIYGLDKHLPLHESKLHSHFWRSALQPLEMPP